MGRKSGQITEAAQPVLEPGEVVEAAAMATVGSMRVGRQLAVAAVTAVATLGMASLMVTPKPQPIVLTTKRFLILGIKTGLVDKADSKIRTEIPRADLRATLPRRPLLALYWLIELTDPDGNRVAKARFTINNRGDAVAFAQGLGQPPLTATRK